MFATWFGSPFLAVIQEDLPCITLDMRFFSFLKARQEEIAFTCVVFVTLLLVVVSLLMAFNGGAHLEATNLLLHRAAAEV